MLNFFWSMINILVFNGEEQVNQFVLEPKEAEKKIAELKKLGYKPSFLPTEGFSFTILDDDLDKKKETYRESYESNGYINRFAYNNCLQ